MTHAYDPNYELSRRTDEAAFYRKLRVKRLLFRTVGEVYVGKRVKLAHFRRWISRLPLPVAADIMEAGSGDGVFAFALARERPGASIVGLELNPVEAAVCDRVAREERIDNLRFVAGTLADVAWRERFDLVYCLDVLEHITDDVQALREMYAALKPGGSILVHVPNRFYRGPDGKVHTVPDEEAWRINAGHVRAGYTPDELRAVLERGGFTVRRIEPSQGPPTARAYRLHERVERFPPLRVLILPLVDLLTRIDVRRVPAHGNTVWGWAVKG